MVFNWQVAVYLYVELLHSAFRSLRKAIPTSAHWPLSLPTTNSHGARRTLHDPDETVSPQPGHNSRLIHVGHNLIL